MKHRVLLNIVAKTWWSVVSLEFNLTSTPISSFLWSLGEICLYLMQTLRGSIGLPSIDVGSYLHHFVLKIGSQTMCSNLSNPNLPQHWMWAWAIPCGLAWHWKSFSQLPTCHNFKPLQSCPCHEVMELYLLSLSNSKARAPSQN
jgi:hypothetical protein